MASLHYLIDSEKGFRPKISDILQSVKEEGPFVLADEAVMGIVGLSVDFAMMERMEALLPISGVVFFESGPGGAALCLAEEGFKDRDILRKPGLFP
jgi:hypothetical protein